MPVVKDDFANTSRSMLELASLTYPNMH